jgi:NitT/TauT family transport system substrate-binding protein
LLTAFGTGRDHFRVGQVKLVVLPPPDMISALANRSISRFIVAEPFNAAAENLRIGRILRFTGDVWQDHACCVVLLKEEDIQQNREWSQRVVNAVVKAQEWLSTHTRRQSSSREKAGENTRLILWPQSIEFYRIARLTVMCKPEPSSILPDTSKESVSSLFLFSYTEELVRRLRETTVEGDKSFLDQLDPGPLDVADDAQIRLCRLKISPCH